MTLTALSVVNQKKYLLEQGGSTSAWKSPLELKEWFCTVDLNLKKNETNDADTLIIHIILQCAYIFILIAFYKLKCK